jgi:diaminopimelate epimerase
MGFLSFPMATIPFSKVQGLGNDFVVVDLRPGRPAASASPSPVDPLLVRALCDRHFGVGADGVLAILPGDQGDARMRVLNADGSEAEMCGNGIRCVAKVLYDTDERLKKTNLRIDTGAGVLDCAIDAEGGRARTVAVEMGRPRLTRAEIPMLGPAAERAIKAPLTVAGKTYTVTTVSMGNPHAVIFVDDPAADLRALAETIGPAIEHAPEFPKRTNVEFARVRRTPAGAEPAGGEIDLVVWERGSGLTLACGTGACATAVAAWLEGRLPSDREIPVHLLGGTLFITVETEAQAAGQTARGVKMRGPAETVFQAEVDLAALSRRVRASA